MFRVIGERINTSRREVRNAVVERDIKFIQQDVKNQVKAGADVIDINAGARVGHELADICWLIEIIQDAVDVPLCIDSPSPKVHESVYGMVERPPIVNSISLEKNRYDAMLHVLEGKACEVVALCIDDSGMPQKTAEIVDRARRLVDGLESAGINRENVYIDPLVQPLSTKTTNGILTLDALKALKEELAGVKTICGLSNISYGLPARKSVNRNCASIMIGAGLSAAIADPLDRELMSTIRISEMLVGDDPFCGKFIRSYRDGLITK